MGHQDALLIAYPRLVMLAKAGAVAVVIGLSILAIILNDEPDWVRLTEEHGVLESIQVLLILFCFTVFLDAYLRGRGVVRIGGGALALLAATAFVREIDVRKFKGPDWYEWIANRGLQEILFASMALLIFLYLWRERAYWRGILKMLLRWQAWPLYLAGIMLVLAQYLDGKPGALLWEELAEIYGYLLLAITAVRHRRLIEDPLFDAGPVDRA